MESSAFVAFLKYFNILLVAVMSLIAILGGVVIFRRKALPVLAPAGGALVSAFCVAALAALVLEAAAFNFKSYLKIFAGPEIEILGVSPENPDLLITSGGVPAEMVAAVDTRTGEEKAGVIFKNLNMNVTSVYVNIGFNNNESIDMAVSWIDEAGVENGFQKKLLKRVPRDKYTAIRPRGKVSELTVMFTKPAGPDNSVDLDAVALNRRIPFYFSGFRMLVVSFLIFAAFIYLKKGLKD